MNTFALLQSLTREDLGKKIQTIILRAENAILRDKSRLDLLEDDQLNCWDKIDEITVDEVNFDTTRQDCVVEFRWESFGPSEEDDERIMHGAATARVDLSGAVSLSRLSAGLEGTVAPRRSPHSPLSPEEQQEAQDAQDYTEYLTKDL
jgi:hypothetical protein